MANNPFDKRYQQRLMGAKRRLMKAQALADACKRCGIEVDDIELAMTTVDQELDKLLIEFTNVDPKSIESD